PETRDAAASVRGGSRRAPDPDRADDSGAGYAAGSRAAMKIAVLFDTLHPEWDDADYKKAVEAKVEEAEYDVARALLTQGHDVLMVGVAEQLEPMLERLATFQPKLVFNGCESFRRNARHEYALAAVLEMHGYRYTGSSPTALLVARNKSLTKKILAYHGIRVPAFAECHLGEKPMRPSELRFPLIVKPLLEDASVGIAQASVVENDEDLAERVKFIHEKFRQAAIVEELIEGRELYVGLVGNETVQQLPIIEMTFGEAENGGHRIATYKAKWDEEYRNRKKSKNVFANTFLIFLRSGTRSTASARRSRTCSRRACRTSSRRRSGISARPRSTRCGSRTTGAST